MASTGQKALYRLAKPGITIRRGELYTTCIYFVRGKPIFDLRDMMDTFPTNWGFRLPLFSLQGFSLKLRVNIDDLTCCALHLVGRCTVHEALARGIWKRWSALEVHVTSCQETHSETGWNRLFHGLEQWQESTIVVVGQQCNCFYSRVLPGIDYLSIWVLPKH